MAINKIIYDNKTLIDITDSTVQKNSLDNGLIAYDKSGGKIIGARPVYTDIFDQPFVSDGTFQWYRDVYPNFNIYGYVEAKISNYTNNNGKMLLSIGTNIDTFRTTENEKNYYIHIFFENNRLEFDISTGSGYSTANQRYYKDDIQDPMTIRLDNSGLTLNGTNFLDSENAVAKQVANFNRLVVGVRFGQYFPTCTYDYIRFR